MKIAYIPQKKIQNYGGKDQVGSNVQTPDTAFPLINLHVAAKKLKDMDVVTVSDPMCVLFIWDQDKWVEFARTEVIWNNLNPEWVSFFTVAFVFELRQPLLFKVYDVDKEKSALSAHDFIGEAQIDLSQIVSNPTSTEIVLSIPHKKEDRGHLFITSEQVENCASVIDFKISGIKLEKKSIFSSNKPFFTIYKAAEAGNFIPVYQSEVDSKLKWKQFRVPYQVLCNLDPERPLKITIFNHKSNKAAEPIVSLETTFSQLTEQINQQIPMLDSKRKQMAIIKIEKASIIQKFSFYDYLRGGVQLNLITGIDFTASNRDPQDTKSLHFFNPHGNSMNQYEACIRSVGEILCPYDSDQLFPVLGFGAKLGGVIQHCFPLTFIPQSPCVRGLDGILGAYKNALSQIIFSGPTLFAPIIRYSIQLANQAWGESRTYTILLIITDGIINDMQDTIDAIVDAGRVPLSIIIVGVGEADFHAMDTLDADDEPLISRGGVKMCRDLVQFVPFNRFRNSHYSVLAREVLEEVPRQLCEWAEMNGIRPAGR